MHIAVRNIKFSIEKDLSLIFHYQDNVACLLTEKPVPQVSHADFQSALSPKLNETVLPWILHMSLCAEGGGHTFG